MLNTKRLIYQVFTFLIHPVLLLLLLFAGNAQGKYQPDGTLSNTDNPYIFEPLQGKEKIGIYVRPNNKTDSKAYGEQ